MAMRQGALTEREEGLLFSRPLPARVAALKLASYRTEGPQPSASRLTTVWCRPASFMRSCSVPGLALTSDPEHRDWPPAIFQKEGVMKPVRTSWRRLISWSALG